VPGHIMPVIDLQHSYAFAVLKLTAGNSWKSGPTVVAEPVFVIDTYRDDSRRYIVRADEQPMAFLDGRSGALS
jgi:hypothetical protein